MSFKMMSIFKFGLFALCAACLAGCAGGATYGTGQTVRGAFAKDLASIATFGRVKSSNTNIDIVYENRSALVVPDNIGQNSFPEPRKGKSAQEIAEEREKAALAKILRTQALAAGADPSALPSPVPTKTASAIPVATLNEVNGKNEKKRSGSNPFGFVSVAQRLEKERQLSERPPALSEVPREYRVIEAESAESAAIFIPVDRKEEKRKQREKEEQEKKRRVPAPI